MMESANKHQLSRRSDRRAVAAEDLSDAELELIAEAEVPADYAHLDSELGDWKP